MQQMKETSVSVIIVLPPATDNNQNASGNNQTPCRLGKEALGHPVYTYVHYVVNAIVASRAVTVQRP
jgi:short-subunit dehydrogenase involved in D-alanine esterification of teichoic acids